MIKCKISKDRLNNIPLSPFWSAVGMFIVIPFAGILMIIGGAITLCSWPVLPVLTYIEKKKQIAKQRKLLIDCTNK